MTILEALRRCMRGHKVRPACWREINPRHWVRHSVQGQHAFFVECGEMEEIPHALRLAREEEFLGPWEDYPLRAP